MRKVRLREHIQLAQGHMVRGAGFGIWVFPISKAVFSLSYPTLAFNFHLFLDVIM